MYWPKPPGKKIMVKAGGFWPGKRAADAITLTWKQGWNYKELCYGKLKKEQKDDLFECFKEVGKANRASDKGGSLHTSGRKTTIDHAQDMAEALNRTVYLDEVFEQTHIRKSGGWVDDRSKMTHNKVSPHIRR
ncbi:hypothetical protein RIF29_00450 [Crotalaria pallida]|uniref:Uncharacterized protein n=1 Tax=Crotalaria pallida TaxID=3830 RepID=A0AAN9IW65_CROPI